MCIVKTKNYQPPLNPSYMVNRFLGWKIPLDNFHPDNGISFKEMFNEHTDYPMKHDPSGTNLFDHSLAREMIEYMLEGVDFTNPNKD